MTFFVSVLSQEGLENVNDTIKTIFNMQCILNLIIDANPVLFLLFSANAAQRTYVISKSLMVIKNYSFIADER